MSKVYQIFNLPPCEEVDGAAVFIAGMECEIESLDGEQHFQGFNTTSDGSLRNNGMEFVSYPFQKQPLLEAFKNLHDKIEYVRYEDAFSERTSTHVHVNCRSLTDEQTKNIILLYALFEEFFFVVAGPHRKHNIHCVPLTFTYLPSIYKMELVALVYRWHKYTALNVLPLQKYGTIEFRHLIGTDDVKKVDEWLTCLENLWHVGNNCPITPELLQDNHQLHTIWKTIFGHSPTVRALEPCFESLIGNQLLDVKFSFV